MPRVLSRGQGRAAGSFCFLAGVLLGVASGSTGCSQREGQAASVRESPVERPLLAWSDQQTSAYLLRLESTSTALGAPAQLVLGLSGRVEVKAQASNDGTQLALRVVDAKLDDIGKNAQEYAALAEELAQPCLFTQRGGVTTAERLPAGVSTFAATILRSLGAALQMGGGKPSADGSWRAAELDGTGRYEVEYRPSAALGPGGFERKKLKYEPTPVPNPNPLLGEQKLEPRVVASSGTLRRGSAGQLEQLSFDEDVSLPLLKGVVSARTVLSLAQQRTAGAWAVDWQALRGSGVSVVPSAPLPGTVPREVVDAQRIGDYTFESALKELGEGAAERQRANERKEPHRASELRTRAFSAMVGLLRQRPELLGRASAIVAKGEAVAGALADALASAGTPEAQAVLVQLLAGPARRQAASSLVRVEEPSLAAEQAVRGLCSDAKYLEFCLYGMGGYARKLRESGRSDRSGALGRALVERLLQARAEEEKHIALRGIANSGDRAAFVVVAPLLGNASPSLRLAAVDAIRLMPGDDVEKALVERLQHDASTRVRLAVVSAASVRPRSRLLGEAIERAAREDTNSGVRHQCVRALVKWLPTTPALRPLLAQLVDAETNESVKSVIATALAEPAAE